MGKLEEAKAGLKAIGMPVQQQNDRSAYTLLALLGLKEADDWSIATNKPMRIVEIMDFMRNYYNKDYKPNSRETIRKETIHQFCEGAIAERNTDDNERATNSPNYGYRITEEALELFKAYNSNKWNGQSESFILEKGTLYGKYQQIRELFFIPVKINEQVIQFSPGKHNELQKSIIEDFAPRFAPGSEVLYVGDTAKKDLIKNKEKLKELGVKITDHDKLPDVVLYRVEKNWIYFIESVTSVGPVSVKRRTEIEDMLIDCHCGIIYVTAFLDMSSKNGFKKFIDSIAWETEIWVADQPDHMIHLNGDRFLGPR